MSESLDIDLTDGVKINESGKSYLLEAAKWGTFIAIVGFVIIGIMLFFGVFLVSSTVKINADPVAMVVSFLITGTIYFFPTYFLFMFTKNVKSGLRSGNEDQITVGFKFLKSWLQYVGILLIIVLSIYLLIFLLFGAGSLLR
jgi:hypothetical protein